MHCLKQADKLKVAEDNLVTDDDIIWLARKTDWLPKADNYYKLLWYWSLDLCLDPIPTFVCGLQVFNHVYNDHTRMI